MGSPSARLQALLIQKEGLVPQGRKEGVSHVGLKLPLGTSPHSQGLSSWCVNHRDINPKCGVIIGSVAGGSASNSVLKPVAEVELQ